MTKNELDLIFKEAFGSILSDYNFRLVSNKKENWGYRFEAINPTTGIEVKYEFREAYIQVILYKLINGQIVRNTMSAITNDDSIAGFSLEWIIALKKPEAQIKSAYDYGLNLNDYALIVAGRLREYGGDVLSGDFSSFGALDAMVKENYQSHKSK